MVKEYKWEPIDFFIFQECNIEIFKGEGEYWIMIQIKWFFNFKLE